MPANVVKTAEDERLWNKAKVQAEKQGRAKDYAYVMGIFQRMKGNKSETEVFTVDPDVLEKSFQNMRQLFTSSGMRRNIPGQIPSVTLPPSLTNPPVLKPKDMARHRMRMTNPVLTPEGVTRDLGLDPAEETRMQQLVREQLRNANNEAVLRVTLAQAMNYSQAMDPAQRMALMDRALSYYKHNGISQGNDRRTQLRAQGLRKAEGEGSRGGIVVGHTSSGKPIYAKQHAHQMTREEFLGKPKRTKASNAKDLRASHSKWTKDAPAEDFHVKGWSEGSFKIHRGHNEDASSADYVVTYDGKPIASYDGTNLVVSRNMRRQGIATHLVAKFRTDNPHIPVAETRTKNAQKTQEAAWEMIQEQASKMGKAEQFHVDLLVLEKAGKAPGYGGPMFIGPKGGKWRDAKHTRPWKDPKDWEAMTRKEKFKAREMGAKPKPLGKEAAAELMDRVIAVMQEDFQKHGHGQTTATSFGVYPAQPLSGVNHHHIDQALKLALKQGLVRKMVAVKEEHETGSGWASKKTGLKHKRMSYALTDKGHAHQHEGHTPPEADPVEHVEKSEVFTFLEKGGGEGSRGGQVIGHDAKGNPIYAHHDMASHYAQQAASHGMKAHSMKGKAKKEAHAKIAEHHANAAKHYREAHKKTGDQKHLDAANFQERSAQLHSKKAGIKKSLILEKAQARGGNYHRRVTNPDTGKHRYFYSEEEYAKRDDAHVSGKEAKAAACRMAVDKVVGDKGCEMSAIKNLADKYDPEMIADVIRNGVKSGKWTHEGGTLKRSVTKNA